MQYHAITAALSDPLNIFNLLFDNIYLLDIVLFCFCHAFLHMIQPYYNNFEAWVTHLFSTLVTSDKFKDNLKQLETKQHVHQPAT